MYQSDAEEADQKERKIGCAIAGWVIFVILLAAIGLLGYRVYYYYSKIRSGEIVDLPQFSGSFTKVSGTGGSTANVAERTVVEEKDSPMLGTEEAELTIVEFADFECPYSREVSGTVRRIMAKHGDKVKLLYRDFPIASIHPSAFQAAVAAECAREQGKFWPYHDKLFANSPALGYADLIRYGDELGMDRRQFEKCVADNRYKAKVEADLNTAKLLQLQGTPTFFFNGQKVEGAIPEDIFERLVDNMLEQTP